MKDRISTKILDNGATRYGVYDETGKLLRYEYIKLEDEPDEEGDFFNKANMLPDSIPAALGLKMENPQVKDALNVLANIGNLHVWENKQLTKDSTITYLTSTDRNAYTEGTVDSTTIAYLGQIGNRARIEVGSYVGTGTYGISNPNSLTFGFEPKIILFDNAGAWPFINPKQTSTYYLVRETRSYVYVVNISWNGKSVSWYSDEHQDYQLNKRGEIYHYIAIG